MKIIIILFLVLSWRECLSETKDENITSGDYIHNRPIKDNIDKNLYLLKEFILQANSTVDKITYKYKCDDLLINWTFKNISAFSNHSNLERYRNFSKIKTGLVVSSFCSSPIKFKDKGLKKIYLRECAKGFALDLFVKNKISNADNIDYIQWCIIEETKKTIDIMEYIKLK